MGGCSDPYRQKKWNELLAPMKINQPKSAATSFLLDQTDHRILGVLRKDARCSIRTLAKQLKLRPSTVHLRLTKLEKNGVIERFTLKLNNLAVGENFIVFIWIATESFLPGSAFQSEHIKEVFGITGEYDLLIKAKFKHIEEFNQFLLDFRKKYNLKKTLTQIVTVNLKEEL